MGIVKNSNTSILISSNKSSHCQKLVSYISNSLLQTGNFFIVIYWSVEIRRYKDHNTVLKIERKLQTFETLQIIRQKEKFPCMAPTIENLSNGDSLQQVFVSHSWKVDIVEHHACDQILVKVHCSSCKLGNLFILSNILDSSKAFYRNQVRIEEEAIRREGGYC